VSSVVAIMRITDLMAEAPCFLIKSRGELTSFAFLDTARL